MTALQHRVTGKQRALSARPVPSTLAGEQLASAASRPSYPRRYIVGYIAGLLACAAFLPLQSAAQTSTTTPPVSAHQPLAQAGQCWVYGSINPKPMTQQIEIQIQDSHASIQVTPAELRQGYKQVVTQEGTLTYRIEPATYRTVEEKVEIRPQYERFVVIPAQFEEQQHPVIVESAHKVLELCREGASSGQQGSLPLRQFCMTEKPAREESVPVQVLVKPETTQVVIEPAQYKTITRRVIDQPARVIEMWHEPVEETVGIERLAAPARTEQTLNPAQTQTLTRTDYEGEPRLLMRQAVCDADLTENLVQQIQIQLQQQGYDVGRLDGKLGPKTVKALEQFQNREGLVEGGVTLETLEQMDIRF